ncbi:hypothetical protein HK405_000150, partial [Cladochytrium tenue]
MPPTALAHTTTPTSAYNPSSSQTVESAAAAAAANTFGSAKPLPPHNTLIPRSMAATPGAMDLCVPTLLPCSSNSASFELLPPHNASHTLSMPPPLALSFLEDPSFQLYPPQTPQLPIFLPPRAFTLHGPPLAAPHANSNAMGPSNAAATLYDSHAAFTSALRDAMILPLLAADPRLASSSPTDIAAGDPLSGSTRTAPPAAGIAPSQLVRSIDSSGPPSVGAIFDAPLSTPAHSSPPPAAHREPSHDSEDPPAHHAPPLTSQPASSSPPSTTPADASPMSQDSPQRPAVSNDSPRSTFSSSPSLPPAPPPLLASRSDQQQPPQQRSQQRAQSSRPLSAASARKTMCSHGKRRTQCVTCFDLGVGGGSICAHRKRRDGCPTCRALRRSAAATASTSNESTPPAQENNADPLTSKTAAAAATTSSPDLFGSIDP